MDNLVLFADSGLLLQKAGKIAAILALLCMAFFIKEPVVIKSYFYKAFREVSKAGMIWQTRSWNQTESPHFIVRYQDQDNRVAQMVLNTAERSYKPVTEKFGFSPGRKTLIVVYPTKEALGRSFGWDADESAMGVYWAGVIRVLSPNAWISEDSPQKVNEVFETEGPLAHELTHLMVDYATGGNYTRWFTEGVAQYEESKVTGYQIEERTVKSPQELYPFAKMDREFDDLDDQTLAYFESYQAVNYLVKKFGENSLKEILTNLGRGRTMDQSFRAALGISMDQFEHNFKLWAVAQ